MAQQYTIHKVEYPIVGGTAAHNYLAVFDPAGNVIHEFHGLATDKNGNPKPIGYLPSDRLKYWHVKESWYYQGNLYSENAPKSRELFSGSYEEVQEKVEIIKAIGKYLNEQDLPYPPFGFTGKNSNAFETTLQTGAGLNEQCGDDTRCKIPDGAWFAPSEGQLLADEDTLKTIADKARQQYQEKLKGEQEVSLTGDETELPDIVVTAEKPEQTVNDHTTDFTDDNHYLNNQDNFFGDHLNQYAEDNGISHINTYDYRQFANDDNSSNRISYLNDYNISFGSGYWNSTVQTVSAFELERLIDHSDWAEVDNILSELRHGTLRLDGSLSHSAEQKLIGNSDSVFADDFFFSRSAEFANPDDYYQSKYGGYNNNPYDLSWEMNAINNSIRQNYVMQEYLAQQEYWDSVINDIQSSTNNMTNTLSGSLNNNSDDIINANSTAIDNNIIAKVSDDPIMLIKDENGIDKAIKASEYAQYQNLLQNSNNAFDTAQQEISEELNYLQKELNQKIDDIGFDIGNSMVLDEYNNQSSINNDQIEKMSNMSFDFDDDIAFNNENNVLAKVSDNPPRLFEDNNGNQKIMTFDEWLKENPSNFEDEPLFVNIEDDINDKYTERDDSDEQDWLF